MIFIKICLDAGHDKSSVNGNGDYKEHEFALDIAKRMQKILSPYAEIIMTRSDENAVSLSKRADIANKEKADIFISIHSNAASSESALGYEWFVFDEKGEAFKLAKIFEKLSIPTLHTVNRGVKFNKSFAVLRLTTMPAILIEHGFHSNEDDVRLLKDSLYRQKIADVNSKAILEFLGVDMEQKEHWAKTYLDNLVRDGVISNADSWSNFDDSLSKKTIGELLALIDKSRKA